MSRWSVIACDQFTSQPDYWEKVKIYTKDFQSSYNLILPEAELKNSKQDRIEKINLCMKEYLESNLFIEYKDSYIYVERELLNGDIRKGIVGIIDLEEYDYKTEKSSRIRATEKTVTERIPPRKALRKNASIELSHVILLCDDPEKFLIESLENEKNNMKKIYDFDLMFNGGNIKGWVVQGDVKKRFDERLKKYIQDKNKKGDSLTFAVGDGNHSLASAKACYDDIKDLNNPARYAMVELENLHDDVLKFEPIHRIVKNINPDKFLNEIKKDLCVNNSDEKESFQVKYYSKNENGILFFDKKLGPSVLSILQNYLDEKNLNIDYIHGIEALKALSEKDDKSVGFEMPEFDSEAKLKFFDLISASGTLPRKTFSMGHAEEKRYYLEARKII